MKARSELNLLIDGLFAHQLTPACGSSILEQEVSHSSRLRRSW